MLIDCDSCPVRGAACADCPVSTLLDPTGADHRLTAEEHRAIEVFTRAGFDVAVLRAPTPADDPVPRQRPARRAGPGAPGGTRQLRLLPGGRHRHRVA